jgi:hypothetical protein
MQNEMAGTTGTLDFPSCSLAGRKGTLSEEHFSALLSYAEKKAVCTFTGQAEKPGYKDLYRLEGRTCAGVG